VICVTSAAPLPEAARVRRVRFLPRGGGVLVFKRKHSLKSEGSYEGGPDAKKKSTGVTCTRRGSSRTNDGREKGVRN